jgi:hypothetical protein
VGELFVGVLRVQVDTVIFDLRFFVLSDLINHEVLFPGVQKPGQRPPELELFLTGQLVRFLLIPKYDDPKIEYEIQRLGLGKFHDENFFLLSGRAFILKNLFGLFDINFFANRKCRYAAPFLQLNHWVDRFIACALQNFDVPGLAVRFSVGIPESLVLGPLASEIFRG